MTQTLEEQINILARYQDVQLKIAETQSLLASQPQEIEQLKEKRVAVEKVLQEKKKALAVLEKQYRDLENDEKINNSRIVNRNSKLNSVKNNKEYQGLLKEIDENERLEMDELGVEEN